MTILKLPLITGQKKTVKEVFQRQSSLLVGVLPCKQVVNNDIRNLDKGKLVSGREEENSVSRIIRWCFQHS